MCEKELGLSEGERGETGEKKTWRKWGRRGEETVELEATKGKQWERRRKMKKIAEED